MQKARRHPEKGAPTACKRTVSGSVALPCPGFFSPFPHGTGPLSVSREYSALADGAAGFRQGFSGPALLRIQLCGQLISGTRLSRPVAVLSRTVPLCLVSATSLSYNPRGAVTPRVWASPLSLAATRGITVVFSSCGYLDVSVPRVRPTYRGDTSSRYRVAPFGHPRINGYLRLPAAFRSLSRPSSPPRAQASPVRSYFHFSSRVIKIVKVFTYV